MLRALLRGPAALSSLLLLTAILRAQEAVDPKPQKTVEERLAELEKRRDEEMRVLWKDGLRFESADKRYKFRIGGRIHYDVGFLDPDAETKSAVETGTTRIEDGAEFRRARIETSGEVADNVEWAAAYDFAGGKAQFRQLWVGLKDLPFGTLRVGQMKEPFSLEQLTSANNIPFIERSVKAAQDPAYNAGFLVTDAPFGQRMTWAVGAFRQGTDDGEVSKGDGEWNMTARVTGLALRDAEGDDWLHLGLSASRRNPTDNLGSFSSRPESNLAPAYVSVKDVPAEAVNLIGAEVAWVRGPLTLAAEHVSAMVDAPSGVAQEPTFSGYYAMASWFLTGEHRPYSASSGVFGAIRPSANAFGGRGCGAWEILARYSSLDLRDDGIDGGQLDDVTLGLNWYLNPNTRVMMNYVRADLDPTQPAADGQTDILEFRVQFAF